MSSFGSLHTAGGLHWSVHYSAAPARVAPTPTHPSLATISLSASEGGRGKPRAGPSLLLLRSGGDIAPPQQVSQWATSCIPRFPGGMRRGEGPERSLDPPHERTSAAYTSCGTGTRLDLVECLSSFGTRPLRDLVRLFGNSPNHGANSKGRGCASWTCQRCVGQTSSPPRLLSEYISTPSQTGWLGARPASSPFGPSTARRTGARPLRCATCGSAPGVCAASGIWDTARHSPTIPRREGHSVGGATAPRQPGGLRAPGPGFRLRCVQPVSIM